MFKAAGRTGDGEPLLVLGLTGENMARLMADEPVVVDAAQLGLPEMTVVLVGGKTEQAIGDDVRRHLGEKLARRSSHLCDERRVCPRDGKPLLYAPGRGAHVEVAMDADPIPTAITAALRNWALMYPIPAWSLAQGDKAERLADDWARVASAMVVEAIAGEFQWGVRTTYADGSQGIDWTNEDEARDFLRSYAEYDAEPHMRHFSTRELVRRPVAAGEIEVAESDYDARRRASDERVKNRHPNPA